jgi:hypothetical protein
VQVAKGRSDSREPRRGEVVGVALEVVKDGVRDVLLHARAKTVQAGRGQSNPSEEIVGRPQVTEAGAVDPIINRLVRKVLIGRQFNELHQIRG